MMRLADDLETCSQIAGCTARIPGLVFAGDYFLLTADDSDKNRTDQQETRHEEKRGLGTEPPSDPAFKEAAETASDDAPTAEHSKETLGLARRPDKVCQRPGLRHGENAKNTHPQIKQWNKPHP